MKILIAGSKGQLGQELEKQGKKSGFEMLAVDLPQLDITDKVQVETITKTFQPSLIVNASAYTNVDKAEKEHDLAFAVNRSGPANLADVCVKADKPLFHISTDYVFDGNKGSPYFETDPVSPLGVYGRSKEQGETAVRSCIKAHIIVRTSWLYSEYGHNFVKTMLRLGKEKKVLRVVADQYGSPTCAAELAETILAIAGRIKNGLPMHWGTYHYCGFGITTWHKFAETIFELAKPYGQMEITRVEPVSTAGYPTPAKRPVFSALDCSLIKKHYGITPKPWQDALKRTINHIFSGA